ncbi:IS66 family transposase, partial [Puniceicoccaceae bacterium K14]|nr:IS66 family transposase [Puniceicoccaceae bacterium K14]
MPPVEDILEENAQLKGRIAELEAQIDWFRRQMFAGGKSEKVDLAQMEFLLKGLEQAKAEAANAAKASSKGKPSKPRKTREELYANLPIREETVIEPEEVKADPQSYERVDQEETFEIKVDPPQFYRRRIVRPKYLKIGDKSLPPVVAAAPLRVVEGIASAELLAYVVVAKYLDHLPLYRQCAIYKRYGFSVSRQNLVRWVEKVAQWLKPIYNHMRIELLEGDYLQADETPIKHCDPDYGEKKSRQGYLCGYSRPKDNVCYKWSVSRGHESVTNHISGFAGVLQADMYQAYVSFEQSHESVELAGCWAHARRKFHDALERRPRECSLVLKLIGKLYAVEKEIRENGLSSESAKALRKEKATNSHTRIKRVLTILRHRSLPKSELGKACDYSLNHWKYLSTYLENGHVA